MTAFYAKAETYSVDVKDDGEHIGRGVLINQLNCWFVITAGHVYFGNDFLRTDFSKITFLLGNYGALIVKPLLERDFAKKNDIFILKVDTNNIHQQLPTNLKILPLIESPAKFSFASVRPTAYQNNDPYPIRDLTYIEKKGDHFSFDIDTGYLQDYCNGLGGADLLKGISGSGLFTDHEGDPILHGIVIKVPNGGSSKELICGSLAPLLPLVENFSYSNVDIHGSKTSVLEGMKRMQNDITSSTVTNWCRDQENAEQHNRIQRKIQAIHDSDLVQEEKNKIVKNLLHGRNYVENRVKPNRLFFEEFSVVQNTLSSQSLIRYANNIGEANDMYSAIVNTCLDTLRSDLAKFCTASEILVLAHFIVSEWLADCMLDFRRKN